MRSFLVGLVFLLLSTAFASVGSAQVDGFVESIGFQGHYRPNCWTPMVVNLTSTVSDTESYLIRVYQEDLDRDHVRYEMPVTVTGKTQAKFQLYFIPRPTQEGLPDPNAPGVTLADLERALVVELCTAAGKPLKKLSIGKPALFNVDKMYANMAGNNRGNKLVLYVVDPSDRRGPSRREWANTIGLTEDVTWVEAAPADLPVNAVGYHAVDYVVWFDANADELEEGADARRMTALEEWVSQGGKLVVCQPVERSKVLRFAPMLPVELGSGGAGGWSMTILQRDDLRPLRDLARFRDATMQRKDLWEVVAARGPFDVARAQAKPGAVVDAWVDWGPPPPILKDGMPEEVNAAVQPKNGSPYIARGVYGHGTVTWVAQDLSHTALTHPDTSGWPYVWARIFGWKNPDLRVDQDYTKEQAAAYTTFGHGKADVSFSLLKAMDHEGKAGFYIFLAVVFFIGYWVVAGPGSYVVLSNQKRKQLSWMVYALAALVATALTVLVVKLVLRGSAEARHITLVRVTPGGLDAEGKPTFTAVADSRVGMYIPRDGPQLIALKETSPDAVSYLTPFAMHPEQMPKGQEEGFTDWLEYSIAMPGASADAPPAASVPYRSTLKKLQARWVGRTVGGVAGSPMLVPGGSRALDLNGDGRPDTVDLNKDGVAEPDPKARAGIIAGVLTNDTGTDLKNVYFAFNYRAFGSDTDWVLYVPRWSKGGQIDLLREFNQQGHVQSLMNVRPTQADGKPVKAVLLGQWDQYWHSQVGANVDGAFDDWSNAVPVSYPIMTLYDRLPPQKKEADDGTGAVVGMAMGGPRGTRQDLLRRGGRHLDMSHLVAAGQLVILAQAEIDGETDNSPLPFPLEVEEDRVTGTGSTLYQFALPLDRSELDAAEAEAAAAAEEDRRREERERRPSTPPPVAPRAVQ